MADMKQLEKERVPILWAVFFSVITAAFIFIRLCWLGSDPPLYFTGLGQGLLTDPYNTTYFTRNYILFGTADPFDYPRLVIFKYSLVSVLSYLFFLIGGVSRITANLTAVLLSTGGVLLYVAGLKRHSSRPAIVTLILLISNMTILVYGRYPLLENGLIFLCALLYFFFMKYYRSGPMLAVTGILIALTALMGKMFGLLLIVPAALVLWFDDRRKFPPRIAIVISSTIVSFILAALLFYGSDVVSVYEFITEQTSGVYGLPTALKSPINFVERWGTFTAETRLFYFAPFVLLLVGLSIIKIILDANIIERLKSNKYLLFNLGWFVSAYVLLMIFNYRPLRYQIFLLLPITAVAASLFDTVTDYKAMSRPRAGRMILLTIAVWFLLIQAAYMAGFYISSEMASERLVWLMLIPSLPLSYILFKYGTGVTKIISPESRLLPILLIISVLMQSFWIVKWYNGKTYLLKQAGEDLVRVVSNKAVIGGPYAQALTIDNKLKSVTYMFGLSGKERGRFGRFPVTHLAVDISNWRQAQKDFPILKDSYKLADYWLRDIKIDLVSIAQTLPARAGINYSMTDFEKAGRYHSAARYPDSVFLYLRNFLSEHPKSKAGLRLLSNYYLSAGAVSQGFKVFDRLISFYPDDFSLYFENGRAYYLFYLNTGNREYLKQSDKYFALALERNKFIEGDIKAAKESLRSFAD